METPLVYIDMIELVGKAVTLDGITYVPMEYKQYEDRIEIAFSAVASASDFDVKPTEMRICAEIPATERRVPFVLGEKEVFWDLEDQTIRYVPDYDPAACVEVTPWISVLNQRVIRIEKTYAEHNLTNWCLEYAYLEQDGYYYWNILDYSVVPVIWELCKEFYEHCGGEKSGAHVQDISSNVSMYAPSYAKKIGFTADNFIDMYFDNWKKPLWMPDGE